MDNLEKIFNEILMDGSKIVPEISGFMAEKQFSVSQGLCGLAIVMAEYIRGSPLSIEEREEYARGFCEFIYQYSTSPETSPDDRQH